MRIQETKTHKHTWLCWPSKIRGTVKIEPEQREDIKHLVNWKETLHLYNNLAFSKEDYASQRPENVDANQ